MPRGDRSGPDGAGPMTGRRMGYCAGFDAPGYVRPGGGYGGRGGGYGGRGGGYGGRGGGYRGGGYGRGMRHGHGGYGYGAWGPGWDAYGGVPAVGPMVVRPPSQGDEAEALRSQAEYLEEALKDVQRRLGELQKED